MATDDPFVTPNELRFGMVMTAQDGPSVRDLAQRIEAAGFDSLWVGDHIAFHVPILESLTLLSFAAAATERVRLGTCVYLLPLRHPTLTAKVTGTLDLLSGGRLTLGVGVGGEFPPEFEACGVPVAERGSRADEAIEVLRLHWTREDAQHQGRHFRFGPVNVAPKPVQPGGPPILVGGRKAPAFRRAGRLGDGYISHMGSPEMYRENLATIREHARAAGRKEVPFEPAVFIFTLLDESFDAAAERAGSMLSAIYRVPFRDAARRYCLLGRPEDVVARVREFVEAGARTVVFSPLMAPDRFLERAEKELLPALRELRCR